MAFTNLILPKVNSEGGSVKASCTVTGAGSTLATSKFQVERLSQVTIMVKTTNAAGTSPTLDIALQKLLPDGSTWQAIAQFTQITGNATRVMHLVSGGNLEEAAATSLTAGTLHAVPFGAFWRLNCAIAGTSPSFDIEVYVEGLA